MKLFFRFFAVSVLLTAVAACSQTPSISLSGTVSGLDEQTPLVIKRLDFSVEYVLDTLETQEGAFSYNIPVDNDEYGYYYMYAGTTKIAGLILKLGDKVTLTTTATGKPCVIEGSEQSLLLQEADTRFNDALHRFDSLMALYRVAPETQQEALNIELGRTFVKYKQDAIRFMFTHPKAFANTAVAFRAFPGPLYVFSDNKDAPMLQRVYDSLQPLYPSSPYVGAIRDRSKTMEQALQLETAFANVTVSDFPDICLPDIQAQTQCLSSLKGKVIVLAFWHSQNVDMRLDNQDLLSFYDRYNANDFAIYQVALDTDKPLWASTLREQSIPWISVCDGQGAYSAAVTTYNVTQVPTYFIIDREGDLLSRQSTTDGVEKILKGLF